MKTASSTPPASFGEGVGGAWVDSMDAYRALHAESISDPEGFWGRIAEEFHWFRKWDRVLEWDAPDAKWFVGGRTNLCYNCVDRQVADGHGAAPAIIWEGEPVEGGVPETRTLSYADLQDEVSQRPLPGPGPRPGRASPLPPVLLQPPPRSAAPPSGSLDRLSTTGVSYSVT